jgi:1,4-dihydroxy-6-naphthoate synthase
MPYSEIIPAMHRHEVDGGIIIHESRFTFAEDNLLELFDLGELYEKENNYPLPLGLFVHKKSVPTKSLNHFVAMVQLSISLGKQCPKAVLPFIQNRAQALSPAVIEKHIKLYVTEETYCLSAIGKEALRHFLRAL